MEQENENDLQEHDSVLGMELLSSTNPNAPDFVKDIKNRKSAIPLPLETQFIPQNPYTLTTDAHSLGHSSNVIGLPEDSTFGRTLRAEFKKWNYTYQGIHAGYEQFQKINPLEDIAPADWNPKSNSDKFVNIKPQYLKYLFDATGPKDQDYRLQRVLQEQADDEALANGSFTAKLLGGALGIVTDPISYIPIVGWAKYAKLAPTFFSGAVRSLPGVATSSILSSAAEQADKINGNMTDFLTDSFVRTTFGSVLFGGLGTVGVLADKMQLWNLRGFAKNYLDGIEYKFATDKSGKITGFKAHDTTGGLSAEKVSFAQDLANSTFEKSGLFKVPYLGEAVNKFLSLPILGSPLPKLLNSPFKTVRGFVDRVADHSIITKGLAEGEVAPRKFAHLMNQEFAGIRALSAQIDALHLERNGFDISNRPLGGLVNLGLNLKDKALKVIGQDLEKNNYISKDDFYSEIEQVLIHEISSEHAPVNEAAAMMRKQMDNSYAAYRKAYNLPADWLPPKTAQAYLMRVYDTPYLNANENLWVESISNWLKEADDVIGNHMAPIDLLSNRIKDYEQKHLELIISPNLVDKEVKRSAEELMALKAQRTAFEEKLQNQLREDPDLQLHVEDWNALSANEAKEIKQLTKKQDKLRKEVEDQKEVISKIKAQISKGRGGVLKAKKVKTAKTNLEKNKISTEALKEEQNKLSILEKKYDDEVQRLQEMMHSGEINPRLFTKVEDSFIYHFKDTNNRLKLRKRYESHNAREQHAKAYYNTILNQTPEDTINQVMGKFTGNSAENPLKQRTLLIPDKVLYDNNFMSKDLMAKVANYTSYLGRRTHLKTVFNDVSVDGGIEPLLRELNVEHEAFRNPLNAKKAQLEKKLEKPDLSAREKKKLEKEINNLDKDLTKTRKEFENAKSQMGHIYEKMMGIRKTDRLAEKTRSAVMSFTAMANLPFVPFTMINDLSAIGLQHGIWPFIRDGVYPIIESLGGALKTKDSEALRKSAPSVHLALQDVLNGYADRNWSMHTNPYLNLGRFISGLDKVAHASTNFTGTNYLENGLQHISGAVIQSEIMRIMVAFKKGTMTEKEGLYVRKYGLDPKVWADRMVKAFKKDGGGKTKLGGYQSNFWQWQDLEASNELGSAVFRGIKDTNISRGIVDSPFWADNAIGSIVHGFSGWMYASVNRYVIPSMQQPDAQKLLGVLFMLSTGALVSPLRRMARGESPYPDNATDKQILWQTIQDSGYFSYFTTILSDANLLTGDRLLGDLKNDKYKDRTVAGLLGPSLGTANRMKDIITAIGTGEMNEKDALKFARMLPFANASWTFWFSKKVVEGLELPKSRRQAHALKGLTE